MSLQFISKARCKTESAPSPAKGFPIIGGLGRVFWDNVIASSLSRQPPSLTFGAFSARARLFVIRASKIALTARLLRKSAPVR
jgi:hypothetical protein